MDRIRKALDLARLERDLPKRVGNDAAIGNNAAIGNEASVGAQPRTAASMTAPVNGIVYRQTRVFSPRLAVLEQNRIVDPASSSAAASAFRMLRTQVLHRMDANGWRSLAVFSPAGRDGKTTTAINLAISLANDRLHTVLLVDFDLQQPSIAGRLDLAPEFGIDDVLADHARLEDCFYHPDGYDRLVVLPARGRLENSSEILAGPRGRELVSDIRKRYPERIIVYDLPPVLSSDDALAFAPLIECGLVVAAEGQTRRDDLVRTVELLAKTPLVGTVLNRASQTTSSY